MSFEQNPYAAPSEPKQEPALALPGDLRGPRGIGGWLVLPLIGLCFTPLRLVAEMITGYKGTLRPEVWEALTTPGSGAYHPLWAFTIVFEVVTTALMLAYTVWVLVLFLRKSRRTPRLMIIWYGARGGVLLVDMVLIAYVSGAGAPGALNVVAALGGATLWIPYFLYSERVKNTFTR